MRARYHYKSLHRSYLKGYSRKGARNGNYDHLSWGCPQNSRGLSCKLSVVEVSRQERKKYNMESLRFRDIWTTYFPLHIWLLQFLKLDQLWMEECWMQQWLYGLFLGIYYVYNQIFIPLVKYVLLPLIRKT